jgi:hypothetical protein
MAAVYNIRIGLPPCATKAGFIPQFEGQPGIVTGYQRLKFQDISLSSGAGAIIHEMSPLDETCAVPAAEHCAPQVFLRELSAFDRVTA